MAKNLRVMRIALLVSALALIGGAALWMLRGVWFKKAVVTVVTEMTGTEIVVDRLNVGSGLNWRYGKVEVEGLTIANPKGFSKDLLAVIPKIILDVDLIDLINGKINIGHLALHIDTVVIEKNASKALNIEALSGIKQKEQDRKTVSGKGSSEHKGSSLLNRQVQIDFLDLRVKQVVYKDFTVVPMNVKVFDVNLKEQHRNISKLRHVFDIVLIRVLFKSNLKRLLNFDMGIFKDTMGMFKGLSEVFDFRKLGALLVI